MVVWGARAVMVPSLVLQLATPALASWGDQSSFYQLCNQKCNRDQCEKIVSTEAGLLDWSCSQNCRYDCMWETVDVMQTRHGLVPQFHGKWPFVRVLGVQEPASVLFSLLNLASNLFMLRWFIHTVPRRAPMWRPWLCYSLTAVNAWLWSSVFHTRDTPTTELLDYFSAFSTVLASLIVCAVRLVGPSSWAAGSVTAAGLAFFAQHVYSMAAVQFDYGYNMKVNVAVGVLNGLGWLGWCYWHRGAGPHIRLGVVAILWLSSAVLLELFDFPPWLWVVDSHAVWHAATAPLPLLWYRFAAGDTLQDLKSAESKKQR